MKRDSNAQTYTDKYLKKLLSMSLDLVIFMKNFKIHEIAEVLYNEEKEEVYYHPLFAFDVEKYEEGKSIGSFQKLNDPIGKVKEKIELSKSMIEKAIA